MRKLFVGFIAASACAVMVAPAQAQVPRHFHVLTTPGGATHTIAQGVTGGPEGMNPRGPLGAQPLQPSEICP